MFIKDADYFCTCKKKRKIEMMTVSEIRDIKESNPEIMREALNQAEKRVADQIQKENDTNNSLLSLFTTFTTILIALISVFTFLSHTKNDELVAVFIAILASFIFTSLIHFLIAYRSSAYGFIGSDPYFWLQFENIFIHTTAKLVWGNLLT